MASLHRFIIAVSAVTVVGVIQAVVPDFHNRLLPSNEESSGSLVLSGSSLTASAQLNLSQANNQNIGVNVIETQNSTSIDQQGNFNSFNIESVNIERANITVNNPYQDTQTGQLYFQPVFDNKDQSPPNRKNHASTNSGFILSDNLQTDVKIAVTGMIARAIVTQTFTNPSNEWVNGLYIFPLPENAAVDHLMIQIDERKIEGQIKEKQEAKQLFEQAKLAGKKASLIEQKRPNLFINNIANIGPGETITISLEYQQTLQYSNGSYSLRFPLGITPRYMPTNTDAAITSENEEQTELALLSSSGNTQMSDLAISNNIQDLVSEPAFSDNINISVVLNTGTQLQGIESEHHSIYTGILGNNKYLVTLDESQVKMHDFVLNWQPELGSKPTSAHFTQFVNGNEYGLIVLYPPLPDEPLYLDREVIFVLDTSGSMSGKAIEQAKQALAYAIDDLSTRDKFNIIEFNSNAEILWRQAKFADPENKAVAFEFVSELSANGGTEMRQALTMALRSEADPELFKQILFITDGSVSNESDLMTLIAENLGQARLFTIGIGSAPNSYFMTEAAKSGKGTFTFIGDTRLVEEKMAQLLGKINAPALTDIKLNLKGIQQYQQFEMYPNVISDLYKSEPLVITYKQPMIDNTASPLQHTSEPMLVGNFNHSSWHFTPKTTFSSKTATTVDLANSSFEESIAAKQVAEPEFALQEKAKGINVVWAREKISQLTRDKRNAATLHKEARFHRVGANSLGNLIQSHNSEELVKEALIQEITSTALEHHIVSEYTSLVAVDITPSKPSFIESDGDNNDALSAEQQATREVTKHALQLQNIKTAQSQQAFALPQTATNAHLSILSGILLLLMSLLIKALKVPFLRKS
jgi:Ca-activated chloride channel family protein